MFHVEQIALFLTASALVAAAEVGSQVPVAPPALHLALATENAEAREHMQSGMLDLLLGWDESARIHFARALDCDDMCSLAYVGLLMTEPEPVSRELRLAALSDRINDLPATPAEGFYLATFLKLLMNDHHGAAEDFCSRAQQFRADTLSACWGILLLHCEDIGYDEDGRVRPLQQRALSLAEELYRVHPQDPIVCFVRAFVEQAAPSVSKQALEAAEKCAAALPSHPIPSHLFGHRLYRNGQPADAVPHFMAAVKSATRKDIPEWESSVLMTSRLYVSTAMWSAGMNKKALATRRAMTAASLDREHLHAPAVILQRWEARTLPLRVLVLNPTAPTLAFINAASKAAEIKPPLPGDDPVLKVRDCLRAALYARYYMAARKPAEAARSLKIAEQALAEFERTREQTLDRGVHYLTPWVRALEACEVALASARAEVFKSSAETWKDLARRSIRPISLMLPPVIPKRAEKK